MTGYNQTGTITHYRLVGGAVAVEEESVVPFAVAARQVREQLDAIKAEKQAAEAEVAAVRAKVNEIEARRVALVATVASAGLQFIS